MLPGDPGVRIAAAGAWLAPGVVRLAQPVGRRGGASIECSRWVAPTCLGVQNRPPLALAVPDPPPRVALAPASCPPGRYAELVPVSAPLQMLGRFRQH